MATNLIARSSACRTTGGHLLVTIQPDQDQLALEAASAMAA